MQDDFPITAMDAKPSPCRMSGDGFASAFATRLRIDAEARRKALAAARGKAEGSIGGSAHGNVEPRRTGEFAPLKATTGGAEHG